jgi:hypothetical protein
MSDQSEKIVKALKQHIDRIVVGVMWAFVVLLVWLFLSERSGGPEAFVPPPPAKIEDAVAANPRLAVYEALTTTTDISQFPEIAAVRTFNMFDYKSVKDREAIEREANQLYSQAETAAARGSTAEAIGLLRRCLQQFPTHQKARELLQKLEGGTAPQGGAAPPTASG